MLLMSLVEEFLHIFHAVHVTKVMQIFNKYKFLSWLDMKTVITRRQDVANSKKLYFCRPSVGQGNLFSIKEQYLAKIFMATENGIRLPFFCFNE